MKGPTRRILLVPLLVLTSVVAAAPDGSGAATAPRIASAPQRYRDLVFPDVTVTTAIQYNESENIDGVIEPHLADVYQPTGDGETRRPLVIWLHPGAFSGGNRGQMSGFATDSARRGYVSASIDYRIRPGVDIFSQSPGQQLATIHQATRDAQGAVRFFREHAATYGIDPDRILVGGYSAGAVVSLWLIWGEHLVEDDRYPENSLWADHPSTVSAAASLAGGWGGVPEPGDPPLVMFHGIDDTTVPYEQGWGNCQSQLAAGNVCEFHTYETTHLLSPWYPEIRSLTADFFYRHVTCGLSFADVGDHDPFCADIDWMATNDISRGYPDGSYRPLELVSRQVAVSFLYDLTGPPGCAPDPGFSDVPTTHPFFSAVAWGVDRGVVEGYEDGRFRPVAAVTRQAMAAFLHRNAGAPPDPVAPPTFADVPPDHPFHDEIAWAASEGIVEGFDDGTFRPGAPITRQAAAAFVHRANDEAQAAQTTCPAP